MGRIETLKGYMTTHTCNENCRKCDGCKECLYVVGFKQDIEAADKGYPMFFCGKCGKNNWWD